MLSIFTIPKPFEGLNRVLQRNAIKSWMQLQPQCEIMLFGDDYYVAETAHEFGIQHNPVIDKNEFGTPLLSSAFTSAQKLAQNDLLVYSNSDIIFTSDLIDAVSQINQPSFLLCGRRWDVDIKEELNFDDREWIGKIHKKIKEAGKLHGPSGIDYFIFPRNLVRMPDFAVGRPGWDSWLLYYARSKRIPVIDATQAITAIHQNHDYSHSKFGEKGRAAGPELLHNIQLAGGYGCMLTLREAEWLLGKNGLRRPEFPRRFFYILSQYYFWRAILSAKRQAQERVSRLLKGSKHLQMRTPI